MEGDMSPNIHRWASQAGALWRPWKGTAARSRSLEGRGPLPDPVQSPVAPVPLGTEVPCACEGVPGEGV